ncbi:MULTISPECIES: TFIIB-type zinc ribbon-containing protein [unclassified Paenibacillus]|uniref:TFIIB-type zinc ribbon-containing protein n=1 Tax=unclassified Paenibacillus TaxID=185978 RepID=UPI002F4111D7
MKCPICDDVRMREVVKDGVAIDVCPDCKGVWLDRGELEKLMQGVKEVQRDYDRMEQQSANYMEPPVQHDQTYYQQKEYREDYRKGKYATDKYGRPYKKKKNMLDVLGDLFD